LIPQHRVDWYKGTNVPEEFSASFFGVVKEVDWSGG